MWERTSVDVHVKAIVAVEVLIGHPRTVCASHTCCVCVCVCGAWCVWFTQSNGAYAAASCDGDGDAITAVGVLPGNGASRESAE